MLPIRTILHPTDFSECSDAGFQLACSLAKDYGARLVLVHVAPPMEVIHGAYYAAPPAPAEDIEALKEQLFAIKPTDSRIEVDYFFVRGEAADEIIFLAQKEQADVIVLGTHGRTGLGRLLMGSVAEKVLRKAPCPVVTVKKPIARLAEENEIVAEAVGAG